MRLGTVHLRASCAPGDFCSMASGVPSHGSGMTEANSRRRGEKPVIRNRMVRNRTGQPQNDAGMLKANVFSTTSAVTDSRMHTLEHYINHI